MSETNLVHFIDLVKPVVAMIAPAKLDTELEANLNAAFPPSSEPFRAIEKACHAAIEAGWMCDKGGEGRRFGRVGPVGAVVAGTVGVGGAALDGPGAGC